jgi:urease accessory protein
MAGDRLLADAAAAAAPQVQLTFGTDAGERTYLERQSVRYPFHLGRGLQVPGDPPGMPTFYVQSCSGGIFEHDLLAWQVVAKVRSRVHLTSAAATVVHAMSAGAARHDVTLAAHAGAFVEYLPDPLILFRAARLESRLTIRAHESATVLACEGLVAHDPQGAGEPFDWFDAQLRIEDPSGSLLARDRYRLGGEMLRRGLPGVTGALRCQGSFVAVTRARVGELVAALREALPADAGCYAGATRLPAGCGAWVRVLARDAAGLRLALQHAWYAARRILLGTEPRPRRK